VPCHATTRGHRVVHFDAYSRWGGHWSNVSNGVRRSRQAQR
jgi:hypothetical protein